MLWGCLPLPSRCSEALQTPCSLRIKAALRQMLQPHTLAPRDFPHLAALKLLTLNLPQAGSAKDGHLCLLGVGFFWSDSGCAPGPSQVTSCVALQPL